MKDPTGENPVRARLIAREDGIAPGEELLLGVHLEQDEGWHTYWKNGGDSGLPTTVEWTLPEGWEVGELQWPTPHRYVESGDLITYGYEGDVVLLAPLRAPDSAIAGETVRIGARVDWLMCKELCIPGGADIELKLTIVRDPSPSPAGDRELIEASQARLPQPASAYAQLTVESLLDVSAVVPGQRAHAGLRVQSPSDPGRVEWSWFPEMAENLFPAGEIDHVDGATLLIGVPFELTDGAQPKSVVGWGGVLEISHPDGETQFVRVDLPVPVAAEGEAVRATNEEFFAQLLGFELGSGGLFDQDFTQVGGGASAGRNILYYLLLALVGGIILNVMPCVLPVLSLKVMSFVRHAGEQRSVQIRLGLMFAAGVLISFLALAAAVIGLQAAGEQLGWGFQFQNPAFVVIMAAIVFAFGLSLFGVYEIILPVQIGGAGGRSSAYAESFLNGILATALATPCTAPFLGTALGFAFTQPAWVILAIFLTIGLGLALPYVLLSLNPAWLRFVPKPGAWMDRFKQGMGFLLMGTLIWLLWVLGQQIGLDGVVWTLAFLLSLGFALWLYGSLLDLRSGIRRRVVVWLGVIALVCGGWQLFLREPLSAESLARHAGRAAVHQDGEIQWRPFDVEELEQEVAAGNTVFLDLTAAWCTTCKVNEKTVLASQAVREKLQEFGVVTFVGDWTYRDPVITRVLRQFGRSGVPFYAVFPAGQLDQPIVLPEVITQGLVIEALEKAGPSRRLALR